MPHHWFFKRIGCPIISILAALLLNGTLVHVLNRYEFRLPVADPMVHSTNHVCREALAFPNLFFFYERAVQSAVSLIVVGCISKSTFN